MVWHVRRWMIDLIIGGGVLLIDRVVKYLALCWLIPGVPVKVGSVFGIDLFWTLTFNQGAAWGSFDGSPKVLLAFRIFFIALLIAVYLMSRMPLLFRTVLAVILAGACGNIVDTIVWGHVVDMIHLEFWGWSYPVFNVADIAICLGVIAMLVQTSFSRSQQ